MVTSYISILPLRSANPFDSVASRLRTILMLPPTTVINVQLIQCQVLATLRTIHCSWQQAWSVDSKFLFKKCPSTKTCKSLATTIRSIETILSRFMANAMGILSSDNKVGLTGTREIKMETPCFQENQMKRLLWKRDHQLHSELQIKVSTLQTEAQVANSSSKTDKSSRTEPMRTPQCKQQSYLNLKVVNLVLIKKIINRALVVQLARRTYLQTVRIMLTSRSRISRFHSAKDKISQWRKFRRQLSAQIRFRVTQARALWKRLHTFPIPTWLTPTWYFQISLVHTLVRTSQERRLPRSSVRTSMSTLSMESQYLIIHESSNWNSSPITV